jgi:hypothetical protein
MPSSSGLASNVPSNFNGLCAQKLQVEQFFPQLQKSVRNKLSVCKIINKKYFC